MCILGIRKNLDLKKIERILKAPTQIAPTKIQNQNPYCACSAFQMEPVQVAEG